VSGGELAVAAGPFLEVTKADFVLFVRWEWGERGGSTFSRKCLGRVPLPQQRRKTKPPVEILPKFSARIKCNLPGRKLFLQCGSIRVVRKKMAENHAGRPMGPLKDPHNVSRTHGVPRSERSFSVLVLQIQRKIFWSRVKRKTVRSFLTNCRRLTPAKRNSTPVAHGP